MNHNDDKLRGLLRQWRDIEPAGNFEANVWRRIRQETSPAPSPVGGFDWLWRPAFVMAASVAVSVTIGAVSGVRLAAARNAALDTPPTHTLTGSYLALTTGEKR